jgi:hypothetical protein
MEYRSTEMVFIKFFDAHVDALFAYCLEQVSDRAEAFERTCEAFQREWERLGRGGAITAEALRGALDELLVSKGTAISRQASVSHPEFALRQPS